MTTYSPTPSTSRQSEVPQAPDAPTIQKLKDKMQQIFRRRTGRAGKSPSSPGGGGSRDPVTSVIETDFLTADMNNHHGGNNSSTNSRDPASRQLTVSSEHSHTQSSIGSSLYERVSSSSSYGTFEDDDILEEGKCQEVATHLSRHIQNAAHAPVNCDLYLPRDLVNKISRDVVRMSQCEPCGLKGCVLILSLEKRQANVTLSQVTLDPDTLATFELALTLMEDKKQWFSWRALLKPAVSRCMSDAWNEQIFISPGYRLVKKKLYREH